MCASGPRTLYLPPVPVSRSPMLTWTRKRQRRYHYDVLVSTVMADIRVLCSRPQAPCAICCPRSSLPCALKSLGTWCLRTSHAARVSVSVGSLARAPPPLQVQAQITAAGLRVVGWYLSHPEYPSDPTVRDITQQSELQAAFRDGAGVEPFVGVIISPYCERYGPDNPLRACALCRGRVALLCGGGLTREGLASDRVHKAASRMHALTYPHPRMTHVPSSPLQCS
jgi:hypothetical protein